MYIHSGLVLFFSISYLILGITVIYQNKKIDKLKDEIEQTEKEQWLI